MLPDESCWFLATDLDGLHWMEDACAFLKSCEQFGIPALLERSRSGNGGHVWMFFDEPVPATLACKLGAMVPTETMGSRPGIGLSTYDRFFPNQDTLPRGGFGNLIALPLQKHARDQGNSLFLDKRLSPFPDQWEFLANVTKITRFQAEDLVRKAERAGRILGVLAVPEDEELPWRTAQSRRKPDLLPGPLPETLPVVLADQIYLPKSSLSPRLQNYFIRMAAFQNPEFYRAQAMRLPVFNKPRLISCAEDFPDHIGLPRGCLDELKVECRRLDIEFSLQDERNSGNRLDLSFHGELWVDQLAAAEAMLAHDCGILSATTAFGKTVLAAWLIAKRQTNTLILVHRQQLLDQWVTRLSEFLGIPEKSIGRLGGGRKKLNGALDVATIRSLVRKGIVDDRVADYGHVIVDECHHVSAHSIELVARRARARFVTGLSATVARKDGHHPIIFMQCGPVRYRVDARKQAAARPFSHHVKVRPTNFRNANPQPDSRSEFIHLVEALAEDESRNHLICSDVLAAFEEGRTPLVLTERTKHLETLQALITRSVPGVIALRGGMGQKEMHSALARLQEERRIVLATGKFVGEGFDDSRLDTLFLALPVSWPGTVAQYAGRLHRLQEGKREVRIYDYADLEVPMLAHMFDRRCRSYESIGYEISVPASAISGWPSEVDLPADPEWKRDYLGSVRRLIRDGVTTPLASLFLHAARDFPDDA
ncbi:MAG: DEAD/DEAH box helicase [Terrimicrobiaceae bacterium]